MLNHSSSSEDIRYKFTLKDAQVKRTIPRELLGMKRTVYSSSDDDSLGYNKEKWARGKVIPKASINKGVQIAKNMS